MKSKWKVKMIQINEWHNLPYFAHYRNQIMNRSNKCRILLFVNAVYLVNLVSVYILLTRSFLASQDESRLASQETIGLKEQQVRQ